jgi:hypothetical protein
MTDEQSPWLAVFALFERFEDGLALMSLFEGSRGDLLANGRPLTDILDGVLGTERAVASAIAERMRQLFDDPGWQYTTFYAATRGLDATGEDVVRFVERARQAGIRFRDSEQS